MEDHVGFRIWVSDRKGVSIYCEMDGGEYNTTLAPTLLDHIPSDMTLSSVFSDHLNVDDEVGKKLLSRVVIEVVNVVKRVSITEARQLIKEREIIANFNQMSFTEKDIIRNYIIKKGIEFYE